MKLKLLFMGLLLALGTNILLAQGPPPPPPPDDRFDQERMERNPERRGRIEEARKNFLKEEMGLTDAEAEKFFPVMKTYEEQMKVLGKKGRKELRGENVTADLTEAEALKLIEEQMQHETKMLELRKASTKAYLEVIPAAKLVKLEPAKRAFRKKLLDRMKRRRRN